VRKKLFLFLFLAAVIALAGCPTESKSSVNLKKSSGVRGIISGVVYDTLTAKPIGGVTVNLGTYSIKTNGNGAYAFNDIPPGKYTISFSKGDYTFRTRNVEVNAEEYKDTDPYFEKEALFTQLEALKTWAESKKIPNYNTTSTGNSWEWTYQDGVWITGDGAKVTYTNGQFEIKEIKLEADYTYGVPVYITGLSPLIGSFKGKLLVYKIPDTRRLDISLSDATPANNIEIWFVDTDSYVLGSTVNDALEENDSDKTKPPNGVAYGPVRTNKALHKTDFTIKMIPMFILMNIWGPATLKRLISPPRATEPLIWATCTSSAWAAMRLSPALIWARPPNPKNSQTRLA